METHSQQVQKKVKRIDKNALTFTLPQFILTKIDEESVSTTMKLESE